MRRGLGAGLVALSFVLSAGTALAQEPIRDEGSGFNGFATYFSQDDATDDASAPLPEDAGDILSDAMTFAMHDASFTMYHEVAHLLIGELDLPVLGKEEDAADALGTIWLLEFDEAEDSYDALVSAADGWYFNALKADTSSFEELAYSADHTLDLHRAYAMVCYMVGKDRSVFGETADDYDIDADRQESCESTYSDAFRSWMRLLEPHITEGDEVSDYEVIYEDAGDYEDIAEELKSRAIVDIAAASIAATFTLPRKVTFRVTQCGEANAYYYPAEGEVIYCYELADAMRTLYVYDIMGWGDTAN
jgi:hypothetical protein